MSYKNTTIDSEKELKNQTILKHEALKFLLEF